MKAFLTGITGQTGSYLAKLLLKKGYEVHGIIRRKSMISTERIDDVYQDPHDKHIKLTLHYGDLSDQSSLFNVLKKVEPDEVYHLGAMSHVKVSFDQPLYCADINAMGTIRLLECIRSLNLKCKFYNAASSEMFGKVQEVPQSENTPFYPRSPYGVSKLFAYWITRNYREAYGLYAVNGILFNHEGPTRGETFVTRKITLGVANIIYGFQDKIFLGNLNAMRDWGSAEEYAELIYQMMQAEESDDYVVGTGRTATVREFAKMAFSAAGIKISFVGKGNDEVGIVDEVTDSSYSVKKGDVVVVVDSKYYRPTEVDLLIANSAKVQRTLGWQPATSLENLIKSMVSSDLESVRMKKFLKQGANFYK